VLRLGAGRDRLPQRRRHRWPARLPTALLASPVPRNIVDSARPPRLPTNASMVPSGAGAGPCKRCPHGVWAGQPAGDPPRQGSTTWLRRSGGEPRMLAVACRSLVDQDRTEWQIEWQIVLARACLRLASAGVSTCSGPATAASTAAGRCSRPPGLSGRSCPPAAGPRLCSSPADRVGQGAGAIDQGLRDLREPAQNSVQQDPRPRRPGCLSPASGMGPVVRHDLGTT